VTATVVLAGEQRLRLVAPLAGMTCVLGIALTSLITAVAYSGRDDQAYSPINHWVSELGEVGVSQLAGLFNVGLMVGGVGFVVFMLGLLSARRSRLAWLYVPIGVLTGVAGFLVGVFPMNHVEQHGVAALGFFSLGWVPVALASIDFYRRPAARFPRWLSIIAALTVAAFVGFLAVLGFLLGSDGLAAPAVRPSFWIVPTLEWAVLISMLVWVFATSVTWWRMDRADAGD
jgi:hypothetical membrane protein